jgi:hypothetical protein
MAPRPKKYGYVFVDHRASPGLTPEQARFFDYDPALAGEGRLFEADTMTCSHCKAVVIKNPDRVRARHECMKCGGHFICDNCAYQATLPDYTHKPFEAKVEEAFSPRFDASWFSSSLATKG